MTIRGKAPILKNRKRRCRQNGQPPTWITRSNRRLGRPGGYFLLLACKNRAIMETTRIPVWIRSEYVTIGSPPFREIRGQEAPPDEAGDQPLAVHRQRRDQNTTEKGRTQGCGLAFFLFRLPLSEKFTKPGLVKGAEVWYNTGISHPGKAAGERKCAVSCTKATEY